MESIQFLKSREDQEIPTYTVTLSLSDVLWVHIFDSISTVHESSHKRKYRHLQRKINGKSERIWL